MIFARLVGHKKTSCRWNISAFPASSPGKRKCSGAKLKVGDSDVHFRMSKKTKRKSKEKMKNKASVILAMLSMSAALTASAGEENEVDGAVFTMNNSSNENQVLVFHREENG